MSAAEGDRAVELEQRKPLLTKKQAVAVGSLGIAALVGIMVVRGEQQAKPAPASQQPDPNAQKSIGDVVNMSGLQPAALAQPTGEAAPSFGELLKEKMQQAGDTEHKAHRMLVYGGGGGGSENRAPLPTPSEGHGGGSEAPREGGGTSVAFKPGEIGGLKAGAALDQTYLLTPRPILCTLDNAIDTTQAGPIYCHTKQDERSPAGVVLLDRETQIVGSYSSNVGQGQDRLAAVSAYGITPKGVPVPFGNAPMGDQIGAAGFPGEVNTHPWARFGGALLLMTTQGAFSVAQALAQHGNNNFNIDTGGMQSAVTEVLRNTVTISATIRKNQGEDIALLLMQPIDFSASYKLRKAP